jgi:hypothetical protein
MTSSFTTNKVIEKPGNGDYVDTWNVPVNGDMDIIDQAFGGTTSLNATGGSATLTDTQYRSLFFSITGSISASVVYTIPSGKAGQWIVFNSTTDSSGGPWTITFASGGGGTSFVVPRNTRMHIVCDGTNVRRLAYLYEDGSGNLAITNNITAGGSVTATTTVTAGTTVSDTIGNVREVPANSQTSNYTLQASDNGKYISITTGGVNVPPSIFSVGQVVSVYNNSGSSQNITAGGGVTLRLVGTTSTGTRSVSNYGLATILCVASNTFVVTGGGVS